MKKLLTFLMMSILAIGIGWADTMTFTTSSEDTGTLSGGPSGVSASITTAFVGYTNRQGAQLTGGNSGAITFTGFSPSVTITKVEVSYCTNSSKGAGTLTATYGTKQLGTFSVTKPSSNGTTLKTATLYNNSTGTTCNATDNFVLSASATANSVYINSVTITYTTASANPPSLPVFSPGAGAVASGTEIAITSAGATSIRYTTDGSTEPTSTTGTLYDENNKPTITAATTLKAIGINANGTSSVATAAYTIAQGTTYERITSTDDLDTDAKYIIVVESLNKAFQNSGTTISASDVTINSGTITLPAGGATEFTLGGSTDNWTFSTGSGYIYNGGSNTTVTLNSSATNWKIEFDGNYVKIHHQASGQSDRILMYNSGFKAYAASNYDSYDKVSLYKEAGGHNVNIASGITGGTVTSDKNKAKENATVTLTVTPDAGYAIGMVSYTPEGGSATTITPVNGVYSFTMPAANVTVSATFTAIKYAIALEILPSEANSAHCSIPLVSGFEEGDVAKSTVGQKVFFRMHTETGWAVPSNYLPTVSYTDANSQTQTCTVTRESTENDGATFSFTMPAADVTISATFAEYVAPLWLLGNNLEGEMSYSGGTPFTYADGNYTLTTYFKGNNLDNGVYFGAFTLTKKNDANSWDDLNESGKRIGPKDGNNVVINASYPTKDLSVNTNSFWIPAGIYTITVNKACTIVTITPITGYSVTLSPNGGDVETGSSVTASETLSAALKAINSDLSDNCATLALSLDGGNTFVDGASHEFSNSDEGTKSVVGKAYYGHIETTSAPVTFTVTKPDNSNKYQLVTSTAGLTPNKKYIIVATVGSDNYLMGANNGSKNASVSSGFTLANDVVTITSATGVEYLTLIEDEGKYYLRNNSNEYYSVSSSSGNTNITTSSTETQVYITFDSSSPYFARIAGASGNNRVIGFQTQNSANVFGAYSNPSASGQQRAIYLYKQAKTGVYTITYASGLTGGSVSGATDADSEDQVEVTVTPTVAENEAYVVGTVTYTPEGGSAKTITPNAEGKYIFTMPAANVTVSATFVRAHNITGVASPTAGGTVTASPNPATYNQRVDIAITPADDYELSGTPTYAYGSSNNNPLYGNSSDGWYLMMPGYDVTVNATFIHKQHTITLVNASDRGTVTGLPAAERTGETINFTVTPSSSNYAVNTVTVTWDETEDGGDTGSVTVTAGSNGSYSFTMPAHNVTVNVTYIVPFVSSDYQLIKSVDDLEAGRDYLIANKSGSAVMGKMQSGYAAAVSTTGEPHGDNNDIISSTEDMAVVTLGGSSDAWTLQTIQGYLHNNGNTKNSLSAGDTPGYATISINGSSGGAATVTFTEPGTYNQLQYNSGSPRFAAYNGGQSKVYFYKETNTNKVKLPVITDRGSFIGVDVVTLTCATADATIWYTTDGSDPSDVSNSARRQYSEPFEITASAYQQVVTVKAYAVKDGMEDSDVRTARFTCGRPDAPTFGNNTPGAYVNPMFVYPKRSTSNYSTYGVGEDREAAFTYYYTLDGSEPTIDAAHKVDGTQSSVPVGKNSNGPFIYMDKDATLKAIVVINGIPSESAGGEYTFSVAAPVSSLEAGTYNGSTTTRLFTETKTQQNNKSWRTYIYYTFADNPTWVETDDWETDSDEELGIFVANEDWTRYDADNAPFITIPYGTHTLSAVTVSEYMNGKEKFVSSTIATTEYTITEANLAIMFTPKPGHYVNSQNVTLNASNPVGAAHIYYTLGDEASDFTYYRDNVNSSEIRVEDGWIEYTTGTPILMKSGITRIRVAAFDQRGDDVTGHLATRDEVFEIGVQPVTFSPIGSEDRNNPANYYSGNQTLEMYSVSPKARVYYAIAEASGTVPPEAPATPDLNSLRYSDDVTINLEAGKSYAVTAVAYVGRTPSAPRTVYYTIYNADNNIQDIATMNNMNTGVTGTLSNPVQVVYMSTHQHDGETPEFAYVRDNSGYGLIYFGNGLSKYKGLKIFERGDWIAGDVIKSKTAVWSDGFINEFGSRNGDVDKDLWPTDKIGHTPILPETMTNARIMEGWDADAYARTREYADGVKENNVWGHYVHLRKNTIDVKTTVSGKYQGIITDESGVSVTYYDGFYNFSNYGTGENATPNYDKEYFDDIKNNGGTVDVYGVVGFYGPLVDNSTYKNNPMEIFPIAFATIYKPMYNINPDEGQIYREPQTISLTCQSVGAQIWYKTSEMEGFELYTNPFTVSQSTTIETYSTLVNEEFNDELESVVNTLVLNIGEVAQPVISPNSVVKAVGDDAVNCTITCDTEGAVIYYTTDGSDPSDENGTREIYNEPLSFSTTTTVRAIAEEGGYYSTEAESRTYTFVYSNGIVFDLVTDESQLDESSVYIIVNQESHMAMSNAQKENNRGATGVMFVDEATKAKVYGNADVALFTLRKYGNNFQFYTTNGLTDAADGYLCVGNGNKLLTESTQDNEANCDATIEITSDNKAHIHFLYNSEVDRYLRFWKRDNLFNCYTTESNGDVYLYRVMASPLAAIEEFGTTVEGKNQYTIADELVCVWQSKNHLWCKDQGNVSIWRTAPLEGQEDFMMNHSTYGAKRSNKTWDQSNWVRIDFDNYSSGLDAAQYCVGRLLDAATISALFIDKNNYTMSLPGNGSQELTKVKEVASKEATAEQLELNVYGPANFLEENLRLNADDQGARGSDGKYYYLVNPKVQEVCIITWAVWDSESNQFVIPKAEGTNNLCDFDGAISIGTWAYNSEGDQSANLVNGEAYTFTAVVESVGNGYGPARIISGKGGQTASSNVKVSPLNFNPNNQEQIVTDVQAVKTGREVTGVTYYNVAGQMSKTPFEGSVNIVVTKYTDGTKKTAKVVF